MVVNAINSTLDSAPNRLNCINVGSTPNVLLGSVLDNLMGISEPFHFIVAVKFIGKDDCLVLSGNPFLNQGKQCFSLDIGNYLGDSVPIALHHAEGYRFARCATATFALAFPTEVGLVNLDLPSERINVFIHKLANLREHAPRCLIGDPKFPLKLFSGDTSFSRSHQKDSMIPGAERGIRLVEDSSRRRRNRMPTKLTAVHLAVSDAVVNGYFLAFRAINAIRPSSVFEKFKASIVRRKLFVKIPYGVGFHVFSPISFCTYTIAQNFPVVK